MRVKSWWSDTIRCEGNIKVVQNNSSVLSTSINNYDFVQNVDGFFKFKQTGLHKSNIYSINLKNTGLSKAQDKETKMYTKSEVIKLLQQKYFIKYYQNEDSFLVNSDENTFIHAVFNSTDSGRDHMIERIDSRKGRHILEYSSSIGLGSREYELKEI